jgi:hypothetical protein
MLMGRGASAPPPSILDGGASNIALSKTATATDYNGSNVPSNAVNGSLTTGNGNNWYSALSGGSTSLRWMVDLGAIYYVYKLGILSTNNWGNAFTGCDVYVADTIGSVNDSIGNFTYVGTLSALVAETMTYKYIPSRVSGRYVMITNINISTPAMSELEVYSN